MQLAELNVSRFSRPPHHPALADFVNNLERVYRAAERMPGFVWRLKLEQDITLAARTFGDPLLVPNLSVWETVEDLEHFVWGALHRRFYERRREWFTEMTEQHVVMWWVEEEHTPTLQEAKDRLELLRRDGPGPEAFGWADLPAARLWRERRCA